MNRLLAALFVLVAGAAGAVGYPHTGPECPGPCFPPPGETGIALCEGEDPCPDGFLAAYDAAQDCFVCFDPATGGVWTEGVNGLWYNGDGVIIGPDAAWCSLVDGGAGDLKVVDDLQIGDDIVGAGATPTIVACTADAADTSFWKLGGGGGVGSTRGGTIELYGNESAGNGGIDIRSGDAPLGSVGIVASGSDPSAGVLIATSLAGTSGVTLQTEGGATDNQLSLNNSGLTLAGPASDDALITSPLNLYLNASRAETITDPAFDMAANPGSQFIISQLGVKEDLFVDGTMHVVGKVTIDGALDPTSLLLSGGAKKIGATDAGPIFLSPQANAVAGIQVRRADDTTVVLNVDTSNQRVGIGNSIPTTPLDVTGTATATLFSGSGASLSALNGDNISSGTVGAAQGGTNADLSASTGFVRTAAGVFSSSALLPWDGSTGLMRHMQTVANAAPLTTLTSSAWVGAGSVGTAANADDADGSFVSFTSVATNGSDAGLNTALAFAIPTRRDWLTIIAGRFKTGSVVTVARHWVGVFASDPSGSDTPAIDFAGFRRSTAVPDTDWVAFSNDGGVTPSSAATGIAFAADTVYNFAIVQNAGNVLYYLSSGDNALALVATISTDLPTAATPTGPVIWVTTLENVSKVIKIDNLHVWHQ